MNTRQKEGKQHTKRQTGLLHLKHAAARFHQESDLFSSALVSGHITPIVVYNMAASSSETSI